MAKFFCFPVPHGCSLGFLDLLTERVAYPPGFARRPLVHDHDLRVRSVALPPDEGFARLCGVRRRQGRVRGAKGPRNFSGSIKVFHISNFPVPSGRRGARRCDLQPDDLRHGSPSRCVVRKSFKSQRAVKALLVNTPTIRMCLQHGDSQRTIVLYKLCCGSLDGKTPCSQYAESLRQLLWTRAGIPRANEGWRELQ